MLRQKLLDMGAIHRLASGQAPIVRNGRESAEAPKFKGGGLPPELVPKPSDFNQQFVSLLNETTDCGDLSRNYSCCLPEHKRCVVHRIALQATDLTSRLLHGVHSIAICGSVRSCAHA